MDFLQQSIRLLSEPPGNVVYHLVTLFALQVVFAISISRWRRYPEDAQAQRLTWASAAIFIGRFILLLVGLFNNDSPQQLAAVLPPLEQAINTMTIALLVWSLIPQPDNYSSRLPDIIVVVILVLSGVLYLFFAQEWQSQIAAGVTFYQSTLQATIWTILQILILAAGLAYLLRKSGLQDPLPTITIVVLLFATVTQLFNHNELIPSDTNIPYPIRLGYLIAFPLWAVYTYQYALTPLLVTQSKHKSTIARFGSSLEKAAQVIETRQYQRRIAKSIEMTSDALEAEFVAIGLVDRQMPMRLLFKSNLMDAGPGSEKCWTIELNQLSALDLALTQGNTTELLSEGLGARQLHDFYKIVGIEPRGPLLIHTLSAGEQTLGLIVAAASVEEKNWAAEKRDLMPGLAKYQAQAILNSQTSEVQKNLPPTPVPEPRTSTNTVPSAILLDQVHLHSLRTANDELRAALDKSKLETKNAEAKALAAQKQARYLAAALRAVQQSVPEIGEIAPSDVDTIISEPNK